MKLGCNWSKELDALIKAGEVEVDFFKACTFGDYEPLFAEIRKTRPILLHGYDTMLDAGVSGIHEVDFPRLNSLLEFCGSPHFGIHLSAHMRDFAPEINDYEICKKMLANIELVKEKTKIPLLVENLPDCDTDRYKHCHRPFYSAELISHVIKTADVSFLLDITHAKISCLYNGLDFFDYISRLPLDRVREIHVNGSGFDDNGGIADTHAYMKRDDFKNLAWVLERAKPEIVTLEYGWQAESRYGAEIDKLKENLIELKKIL